MMPLKNLLYLLQLEEYDLKRFSNWLKNNPGCVVLEKKKRIDWTLKAHVLFALANIFNIFTFGNRLLAIKISSRFFRVNPFKKRAYLKKPPKFKTFILNSFDFASKFFKS